MLYISDQLKRATARTQHLQRGKACYKKNCHSTKEGRCLYGPLTTAAKQLRQVEHTHTLLLCRPTEARLPHQESQHLQNLTFYSCLFPEIHKLHILMSMFSYIYIS